MNLLRVFAALVIALGLAACSSDSKFQTYTGPEITHILISKTEREMYLFHEDKLIKTYPVDFGFAAKGHKQFEGDGKTPEGTYRIDRRNPNSAFHLSLGISYPNAKDIAFAKAHGKNPGGDIFIHGQPNGKKRPNRPDWTAGCIAVTNEHMEEIYAMIGDGTLVTILP
jgi:murein L,D-transpeptidase YafK